MKNNYIIMSLFLIILGITSSVLFGQTTFNYSGGMQTYTVPAGVGHLDVVMTGASGGLSGSFVNAKGYGGRVATTLSVIPGDILYIFVGGEGTTGAAGYNGGGAGSSGFLSTLVGGGGGASDIRYGGTSLGNRVIVAGGGGGAGYNANEESGGAGGGLVGGEGQIRSTAFYGGQGGTQSSGGAGGYYDVVEPMGSPGLVGVGGSGSANTGGAGGAGGYFGGGGGSYSGGGGGSSYANAGLTTSTTHTQGANDGNGQIVITEIPCSDAISISVDPGTNVCPGTMVTLTATSINGGNIIWNNGITNGVPFAATGTVTYTPISDDPADCPGTITIIAEDNLAPVPDAGSLPDLTDECSVTPTAPSATDACAGTITGTTATSIPVTTQGTTVITWTYDDGNGNSVTQTQNVIITDVTDPEITCLADISVSNDVGICGALVTYTVPVGTDNCAGVSTALTAGLGSGAIFPAGTTTETYTVTDIAGNTASCSFTVTVTDNENPEITCPADITVGNDAGTCEAVVTYTAPVGTDNCLGATTAFTSGLGSGAIFPVGISTETYTVTDAAGNTSSCSFTVTVLDAEAPVPDAGSLADLTGECSVDAPTAPTATDNCMGAITGTTSTTFPVTGTTVITWTFNDGNGNSSIQTQNINITDVTDPEITCLADITVNNDAGICGAIVNYTAPVGTDNCTGVTTALTAGLASGATFPVGTTIETYTVTDVAGNSASCSFTITVVDSEDPEIICLADITVDNDPGTCGAVVTYTAPVGTDNCPGVTTIVTAGLGSGATFSIGSSTETYTVTDLAGNSVSCSFTITVVDAEDPEITCPADYTRWNWAGECWNGGIDYTVPVGTDNCSGATTVLTSGLGLGVNFPVGNNVETYTVTDAAGNTATCSFTITIWDEEDPTILCPPDITVNNDVGECGAIVTYTTPEADDNCGVTSLVRTEGPASGILFPIGTTIVTHVAYDSPLQTAECSFTVTVTDTEAPTIVCGEDITANNDPGICGAVITYSAPDGVDNCAGAVTTQTGGLGSGSIFPVGTTTETFVVIDAVGLSDTCSFTITVVDAENPAIVCPADITVDNDAGMCDAVVSYVAPIGTDNCTGVSTALTAGLGSDASFPIGISTETYVVTDAAGNTNTCSFTVTVNDAEALTITCPDDKTICQGEVVDLAPVIEDNCPVETAYMLTGATIGNGTGSVLSSDLNAGITTVQYTVTDGLGNSETCNFSVTVGITYEETIVAEICDGDSYTMPDGTTKSEAGTYTLNFVSEQGCDSIFIVTLTVKTIETGVTLDETTLIADKSGAEYQWVDCNNSNAPINGETNQSFTATESGSFAVNVTEDGCSAISDCFTITITGLQTESKAKNILAYPNPVIDNLTIDLGEVYQSLKVSILDLEGQVIYEYRETDKQVLNYELNELSSGIYFIKISYDEKSSIVPFTLK